MSASLVLDPKFNFTESIGFHNISYNNLQIQDDCKILLYVRLPDTNRTLLRINSDGSIDSSFNTPIGSQQILVSKILDDGKILIGGSFTTYSGTSANRLVKLNSDGTIDSSFTIDTGFTGSMNINSIEIQNDDKILIGGSFTHSITGTINIARLNSDGSIDTSFSANTTTQGGTVYSTDIQNDGKIIIGGLWFNNTPYGILRLNSDGSIDSSFDAGNGFSIFTSVYSIKIQDDNKIIVAGDFTSYSGQTANGIIRLNSDGSIDTSFNSGSGFAGDSRDVYNIYLQDDGKIIVGGEYTSYSGISSSGLTRLNSDGTFDTSFTIGTGFENSDVYNFGVQDDGKIIVAGDFSDYNGTTVNNVVRLIKDITEEYCSTNNFTITNTTCGNNNGSITIENPDLANYLDYYNFSLEDVFGNTYSFDSCECTISGLSAGYYFLTATPIAGSGFTDSCEFNWIEITDSDTTIVETGRLTRGLICGSFNSRTGRDVITVSGASQPFTYYIYKSDKTFVTSASTSDGVVLDNLTEAGDYYYIVDDGSCHLLGSFSFYVTEESSIYSVPGISRIFISEWDEDVDWNYWSTSDEDYYYAPLDINRFQSTKIKEFINPNTWYEVPVEDTVASFGQTLQKVRQGFLFTNELSIAIPYYNKNKWSDLKDVLTSRYIVVFQDYNNNYWTFGFQNGAEAQTYSFTMQQAAFTFSFVANSGDKIITALDENYVKNNIL